MESIQGFAPLILMFLVVYLFMIRPQMKRAKQEKKFAAEMKKGDKVVAFEDEAPVDTVLGIEIFPVIHVKTQEKIYVSLEDIKE